MSAIVVLLIAVAIMLVSAVGVAVMRLVTALRGLRDAVQGTQQWLEPVLTELHEAGQVASLEAAQLQASVADLRARDRRSSDTSGYTA